MQPHEPSSRGLRYGGTLVLAVAAAAYFMWFLSFPVLAGLVGTDGEAIARLQFLSRLLLPEMWWGEVTGGGRLPLGMGERWLIALGGSAWLGIAWMIGRPMVRLGFQEPTRVEAAALAILAGLALLSTATLLVGLAGGSANRWATAVPVGVMLAAAWFANRRVEKGPERIQPTDARESGSNCVAWLPEGVVPGGVFGQLAGRLVVVLTLVLAMIYGLGVLMPPFEFDVVEYHLQSAKEFYQLGCIGFNDHNIYVNMPLGLEMHSLAAMSLLGGPEVKAPDGWWLGGMLGKAVIGAHALIAAALVGGFVARKTSSQWVGCSAAGLWLSVPGNAHVATSGLIDTALSTYILASLVGVSELWSRHALASESASRPPTWLVFLIFVYAGAAAAAKYPGLIYAVAPSAVAVALAVRAGRSRTGSTCAGASQAGLSALAKQWLLPLTCGLAVTCVPWYAKNAVLTGNPVYPLAYSLLGGRGLDTERAEQWSQAHRVPVDSRTGSAYSLSAWFQSARQIVVASEFAQPSLALLVICGLLGATWGGRSDPRLRWPWVWMAWSAWILLIWWVATHRIDRFWLPAVSIWAVVAGAGLAWLATRVSHGLGAVLVLAGLAYGIVVNASPTIGDNRYFVSLKALREDGGDEENVGRVSRTLAWCNQNLSPNSVKLLLVGEARVFDFKLPILYSTCFDVSPAEKWLRGQAAERQLANLRAAGVTHLMVNWTELARYRSPGNYGFSDWPSRAELQELVESNVLRRVQWPFAADSAELFEVAASDVSGVGGGEAR